MDKPAPPAGLYARILGDSWARLAESVRAMHSEGSAVRGIGLMRISHGANRLVRWLAVLLRLPGASPAVPVTLAITPSSAGEEWRRTFADMPLVTRQWSCRDGLLAEQAGLTELQFKLEVREGGLIFHHARSYLRLGWLRIPLPYWLAPTVTAREMPAWPPDGTEVSVQVHLPVLGVLISYEGRLTRCKDDS
jgi:hypothetical protein